MKNRARRPPVSFRPVFCAVSLLFFSALPCPAHAQQVSRSLAQGTHLFRRILYDLHLRALSSIEQLDHQQAQKLLIVLGETEFLAKRLDLEAFVQQGGAVLLATDRFCKSVLRPFSVEVRGFPVRAPGKSRFSYKGSRDCIFVQPHGQDSILFTNLSVEKGLSRVATNKPGYLAAPDSNLQLLASFPPGCFAMDDPTLHSRRREQLPFAVGGDWGRGRILILSDHSVFINAMMWQPDIDNFDFAYNCVNWLIQGDKRRDEVLFLEEGAVQENFHIALREPPTPPLPPLKAIVETVDKGLGELERDNAFNRAIRKSLMTIRLDAMVLMSTLALAVFGLALLTQARHRHDKAAMLPGPRRTREPDTTNLFEQRHESMLREGNFWESARTLARQGFESALGPEVQGHSRTARDAREAPLPLRFKGSWWRTWRLRRRLNRLWQLAYGMEPVRISSRQLRRLRSEIETMRTLLARFGVPHDPDIRVKEREDP